MKQMRKPVRGMRVQGFDGGIGELRQGTKYDRLVGDLCLGNRRRQQFVRGGDVVALG